MWVMYTYLLTQQTFPGVSRFSLPSPEILPGSQFSGPSESVGRTEEKRRRDTNTQAESRCCGKKHCCFARTVLKERLMLLVTEKSITGVESDVNHHLEAEKHMARLNKGSQGQEQNTYERMKTDNWVRDLAKFTLKGHSVLRIISTNIKLLLQYTYC